MGQDQPEQPPRAFQPQDERLERLRALRQRREQSNRTPMPLLPAKFQRRGVPLPPSSQPPLKAAVKHWWEHGPFAGAEPMPSGPINAELSGSQLAPERSGARSVEARARELATQGRKVYAQLSARAQKTLQQARRWLAARTASTSHTGSAEAQVIPGLILIGFAADVARQEAVGRITALGGKPLRYKAATNLFQVAVPPGQEVAFLQWYRQQPGVVLADLERTQTGQP